MTTLSPTTARANLTHRLKRAASGADIGILCGDKVIALRAVSVVSEDCATSGSGVTGGGADAVAALIGAFGKPHLHSGLRIRRPKRDYFEFRADRNTPMVFKLDGSSASLLVGNRDEVQRFLKNR